MSSIVLYMSMSLDGIIATVHSFRMPGDVIVMDGGVMTTVQANDVTLGVEPFGDRSSAAGLARMVQARGLLNREPRKASAYPGTID
jgi:hypothetical protein